MLKIGITGNIASGKSLFENCLKNAGYKVLCLDFVTAFLYENSPVLKDFLLKKFNTIDKAQIAKIVFSNQLLKKELENFIYPLIMDEMNKFFAENTAQPVVFVSAALLFESGFDKYFDKIVFIKADENIRLKRLMERNNLSKEKALQRLNSQSSESEKIPLCDFVIDNSSSKEALYKQANDFIKSLNTLL